MTAHRAEKIRASHAKASSDVKSASLGRATSVRRRAKERKFFIVTQRAGTRGAGYRLLNENELFENKRRALTPPIGRRGFEEYLATPTFMYDRKLGPIEWDFKILSGYWFISDRMKGVMEFVDQEAFAFLKCKVLMPDGSDGPPYWLCDVVRVLEALDEEKSAIKIRTASDGSKVYGMMGNSRLIFKEELIGSCHVFRMKFFEAESFAMTT